MDIHTFMWNADNFEKMWETSYNVIRFMATNIINKKGICINTLFYDIYYSTLSFIGKIYVECC